MTFDTTSNKLIPHQLLGLERFTFLEVFLVLQFATLQYLLYFRKSLSIFQIKTFYFPCPELLLYSVKYRFHLQLYEELIC